MRHALMIGSILALSACAAPAPQATAAAPLPPAQPAAATLPPAQLAELPAPIYRIQEGDVLDIRFRFTPELNDTVTVRLDGRVSLTYLPDLSVADMTVDQLHDALVKQYVGVLSNPTITVSVHSSTATRVFVGGEVITPGEFNFTGRGTLSQYLTKAGGLKSTGAGNRVLLIRRGADFRPVMSVLDADAVFDGKSANDDISLRPYDVVYVPPSNITMIDRFADQYVRQIVPVSFALNYLIP